MMYRILPVAVLIALASSAWAVLIRDDRDPSEYEELSAAPEFQAAGWLVNTRSGARCSAVLIGERTVLAAAHCFGDNPSALGWVFGVGPDAGNGSEADASPIARVVQHPDWNAAEPLNVINQGDIAILTLARPITGVVPANITTRDPNGEEGVFVGYGGQGTILSGPLPSGLPGTQDRLAGQVRLANSSILGIPSAILPSGHPWLLTQFDPPPSPDALDLGVALSAGDSGGPVFVGGSVVGFLSSGSVGNFRPNRLPSSNFTWLGNPTVSAWLSSGVLDPPPANGGLPEDVTSIFPAAFAIDDDWALARSFGYFAIGSYPWAYHEDLGWIYMDGPRDDGFYFYDDAERSWFFTTPESLPFFYSFEAEDWIIR